MYNECMKFMVKFWDDFMARLWGRDLSVDEGVRYSVGKYGTTYEMLEKYDKEATKNPEVLAHPGRLRKNVRVVLRNRKVNRRTNASV